MAYAADSQTPQPLRRDAARNRERLLDAALRLFREHGERVSSLAITQAAGLGAGTLYNHFRSREQLVVALVHRSYGIALEHATAAADSAEPAAETLRAFLARTVARRDELWLLPLHGGPVMSDAETLRLRAEISDALERLLARGRSQGGIRAGVTATDIILMGALLAQPLPNAPDWDAIASRQIAIYVDGLRPPPASSVSIR